MVGCRFIFLGYTVYVESRLGRFLVYCTRSGSGPDQETVHRVCPCHSCIVVQNRGLLVLSNAIDRTIIQISCTHPEGTLRSRSRCAGYQEIASFGVLHPLVLQRSTSYSTTISCPLFTKFRLNTAKTSVNRFPMTLMAYMAMEVIWNGFMKLALAGQPPWTHLNARHAPSRRVDGYP